MSLPPVINASPAMVCGRYSRWACAVSLDRPVTPNVKPATAASTAATDGALRERCRARSRAAIRKEVGIRLPSRPTRVSSTGTRNNAPRMSATAPIVTRYSAPNPKYTTCPDLIPAKIANEPAAASTSPHRKSRMLGRGDTLWPRITPTMSSRPSRRAGARAATMVLAAAHSAIPASSTHRTSKGPVMPSPSRFVHAMTPRAAATPSSTPSRADAVPRTRAWASTVRRSTAVLAPLLAARARVRRCRAALTANAGPTSSAVMMSSITAPSATMMLICCASLPQLPARAGSSS